MRHKIHDPEKRALGLDPWVVAGFPKDHAPIKSMTPETMQPDLIRVGARLQIRPPGQVLIAP
jgi:hypothetical protein